MRQSHNIQLFLTPESECNYLPERSSQMLCLDQFYQPDTAMFSALTEQGFRSSGSFIYRPQCQHCQACVPVRIDVARFQPTRQQQKTLRRGRQLKASECMPGFTEERYQLYQKYISVRHIDGSMFPPSVEQFESFLCDDMEFARFFEFRLDERLLAVAVTDILYDGLSAVYSFFDPHDKYFSLGRYAILWQIMQAKELGLDFLYLGYWIENHNKMHYKAQYQPIQGLLGANWQTLG